MRSFSRMFQLLAVVAAFSVPAVVRADDPPADEAASKRGQAVLEALTEAKDDYCGATRLGIHMGGKLVGYLHAELKKAGEGYEFKLEARMNVPGAFVAHSVTTGTLDAGLALTGMKGESHSKQADQAEDKVFSVEVKDDDYHYTLKVGAGDAATSPIDCDGDLMSDAFEVLAIRRWVSLPAGEAHRFSSLDGEEGKAQVVDITTSAPRKVGDKDVVDVKVVNHTEGKTAVYGCDAKTGAIVEAKFEGAPMELKPMTADEVKAWQDANK